MKKGFWVIIFIFFISSCGNDLPEDVQLARKITAETALELRKEEGLQLVGTGSQMMYDIEMLEMSFQIFHQVDLEEARSLLVHAVKAYITAINSNERIRPFLCEYPFTAKNVRIHIWVRNPDRTDVPIDKIYYFSAIKGVLTYYVRESENSSRKAICEETYEEALKMVEQ